MKEDIYYIARVGEMWVKSVLKNIGSVHLGLDKEYATHINEVDAEWLKEQTGAILIRVNVVVTETEVQ